MNATLSVSARSNARNLSPQKETVGTLNLIGIESGKPVSLASVRFYMARSGDGARPVYCSVWLFSATWCSGYGRANGYGYHKQSAALDAALSSAGVKLYKNFETRELEHIDGVGDSAMNDALLAVGEAMGFKADSLLVVRN